MGALRRNPVPEAIDRKLLAPFQYFGVTDTVDLDGLRWSRGGYLASELEQAYVKDSLAAQKRAEHILRTTRRYVSDIQRVRGLGFCVSVAHAEFIADYFNTHGVSSFCVTGKRRMPFESQLRGSWRRAVFVLFLRWMCTMKGWMCRPSTRCSFCARRKA